MLEIIAGQITVAYELRSYYTKFYDKKIDNVCPLHFASCA